MSESSLAVAGDLNEWRWRIMVLIRGNTFGLQGAVLIIARVAPWAATRPF